MINETRRPQMRSPARSAGTESFHSESDAKRRRHGDTEKKRDDAGIEVLGIHFFDSSPSFPLCLRDSVVSIPSIDLQWFVANDAVGEAAPSRAVAAIDLQWFVANGVNGGAAQPRSVAAVDLQWFAAEDEGRTEDPSEYKLRKAREEGRVAKSQDLVSAVVLLFGAVTLAIAGPAIVTGLIDAMLWYFSRAASADITKEGGAAFAVFASKLASLALPVAAVAMVAGVAGNIAQTGFLFTTKPLTPDFKKIVPRLGQYLSKTVFSMDGMYRFAMSLVKIAVIALTAWIVVSAEVPGFGKAAEVPLLVTASRLGSLALRLVITAAVVLLLLAIPDVLFQRRQFKEQMKMTREEVKEERKMHEGDPLVKGRLKQRMRELLSRNMAANVPKADVVITNPTHYAIALEWNRERMAAPVVTAKGRDEIAQRIKAIAKEHGVPTVENRPLARALYAEVEIGDSIPEKYYQAMAAVLAHVYAMDGRARDYAAAATEA